MNQKEGDFLVEQIGRLDAKLDMHGDQILIDYQHIDRIEDCLHIPHALTV